jgi:hypothetical protein
MFLAGGGQNFRVHIDQSGPFHALGKGRPELIDPQSRHAADAHHNAFFLAHNRSSKYC